MSRSMKGEAPIEAADAAWSEPERWAWTEIRAGRVADFAARDGAADPLGEAGWTAERTLGTAFLRSILTGQHWAGEVPADGVRISGARWADELIIPHARLGWPLCLEGCRFDAEVDFTGLAIAARLAFTNCAFRGGGEDGGGLRLDFASAQRADLSGSVFARGLSAVDATFAGALELSRARSEGRLDLTRLRARCVRLRDATVSADTLLSNGEIDQDVDFSGASIGGAVRLNDAQIGQDLWLGGSKRAQARVGGKIDLVGASVGGIVSMCGLIARGPVEMNSLEVEKNLFMRAPMEGDDEREEGFTLFYRQVDMSHAVIRGYLVALNARFCGEVLMASLQIGENLLAAGSGPQPTTFKKGLSLATARIKGSVDLQEVRVKGDADCTAARIDGDLDLSGAQLHRKLDLTDARIEGHLFVYARALQPKCGGDLVLQNATIGGTANLEMCLDGAFESSGLQAGSLFARRRRIDGRIVEPVFKGPMDLGYASIDRLLDLNGARIEAALSLNRIHVGADLRMRCNFVAPRGEIDADGHEMTPAPLINLSASTIDGQLAFDLPLGGGGAGTRDHSLDLRDAKAGSLQIFPGERWPAPKSVQLDGFSYDRLGGFDVPKEDEMTERSADWFGQWLALDLPFSPQPYEQLVAVLRQAGQNEKANRILHASRERVRKEAWSWREPLRPGFVRAAGLFLLKVLIGYGIGLRFFYALFWAILLTAIGVWMLGPGPVGEAGGVQLTGWWQKTVYSFDLMLPIFELDRGFNEVRLPASVAGYFWAHRLLGFLLGGFITAGIAGLTQRSRA
jgi:hypothetical protein